MANAGHARLKTSTVVMGDDARRTSRECSAVEDLGLDRRWMSACRRARAPSVGWATGCGWARAAVVVPGWGLMLVLWSGCGGADAMSLFAGSALVGSARPRPISCSVRFCSTQQDPSQRRVPSLLSPCPPHPPQRSSASSTMIFHVKQSSGRMISMRRADHQPSNASATCSSRARPDFSFVQTDPKRFSIDADRPKMRPKWTDFGLNLEFPATPGTLV